MVVHSNLFLILNRTVLSKYTNDQSELRYFFFVEMRITISKMNETGVVLI